MEREVKFVFGLPDEICCHRGSLLVPSFEELRLIEGRLLPAGPQAGGGGARPGQGMGCEVPSIELCEDKPEREREIRASRSPLHHRYR